MVVVGATCTREGAALATLPNTAGEGAVPLEFPSMDADAGRGDADGNVDGLRSFADRGLSAHAEWRDGEDTLHAPEMKRDGDSDSNSNGVSRSQSRSKEDEDEDEDEELGGVTCFDALGSSGTLGGGNCGAEKVVRALSGAALEISLFGGGEAKPLSIQSDDASTRKPTVSLESRDNAEFDAHPKRASGSASPNGATSSSPLFSSFWLRVATLETASTRPSSLTAAGLSLSAVNTARGVRESGACWVEGATKTSPLPFRRCVRRVEMPPLSDDSAPWSGAAKNERERKRSLFLAKEESSSTEKTSMTPLSAIGLSQRGKLPVAFLEKPQGPALLAKVRSLHSLPPLSHRLGTTATTSRAASRRVSRCTRLSLESKSIAASDRVNGNCFLARVGEPPRAGEAEGAAEREMEKKEQSTSPPTSPCSSSPSSVIGGILQGAAAGRGAGGLSVGKVEEEAAFAGSNISLLGRAPSVWRSQLLSTRRLPALHARDQPLLSEFLRAAPHPRLLASSALAVCSGLAGSEGLEVCCCDDHRRRRRSARPLSLCSTGVGGVGVGIDEASKVNPALSSVSPNSFSFSFALGLQSAAWSVFLVGKKTEAFAAALSSRQVEVAFCPTQATGALAWGLAPLSTFDFDRCKTHFRLAADGEGGGDSGGSGGAILASSSELRSWDVYLRFKADKGLSFDEAFAQATEAATAVRLAVWGETGILASAESVDVSFDARRCLARAEEGQRLLRTQLAAKALEAEEEPSSSEDSEETVLQRERDEAAVLCELLFRDLLDSALQFERAAAVLNVSSALKPKTHSSGVQTREETGKDMWEVYVQLELSAECSRVTVVGERPDVHHFAEHLRRLLSDAKISFVFLQTRVPALTREATLCLLAECESRFSVGARFLKETGSGEAAAQEGEGRRVLSAKDGGMMNVLLVAWDSARVEAAKAFIMERLQNAASEQKVLRSVSDCETFRLPPALLPAVMRRASVLWRGFRTALRRGQAIDAAGSAHGDFGASLRNILSSFGGAVLDLPSPHNDFELLLSAPVQSHRLVLESLAVFFNQLQDALESRVVWISTLVGRVWKGIEASSREETFVVGGDSLNRAFRQSSLDLADFRRPLSDAVAALRDLRCFVAILSDKEFEFVRLSGLAGSSVSCEEEAGGREERARLPLLVASLSVSELSGTPLWLVLSPGEGLSCSTLRAVNELLADESRGAGEAGEDRFLAVSARVFGEPAAPWRLPCQSGGAVSAALNCCRLASGGQKALGLALRLSRGCRCYLEARRDCPHQTRAASRIRKILHALEFARDSAGLAPFVSVLVPCHLRGRLIGPKGENQKRLMKRTGAFLYVVDGKRIAADGSAFRVVRIGGPLESRVSCVREIYGLLQLPLHTEQVPRFSHAETQELLNDERVPILECLHLLPIPSPEGVRHTPSLSAEECAAAVALQVYAQLIDVQVTLRVPKAFQSQEAFPEEGSNDVMGVELSAVTRPEDSFEGRALEEPLQFRETVQIFRQRLEEEGISVSAAQWLRKGGGDGGDKSAAGFLRLTLSGCSNALNERAWPALQEASEAAWGKCDGRSLAVTQEEEWFLFYQTHNALDVTQQSGSSVGQLQEFPSQWRALPVEAVEALETAVKRTRDNGLEGVVGFAVSGVSFQVSVKELVAFCSQGEAPWIEIQASTHGDLLGNVAGPHGEDLHVSQGANRALLARICIKNSNSKRTIDSSDELTEVSQPASYFLL